MNPLTTSLAAPVGGSPTALAAPPPASPPALAPVHTARAAFHPEIVAEVAAAVAKDDVVVVGMAQNPVVRGVRRWLDAKGVRYTYLGYGSYLSKWRPRLAIKLWSGWPTFPQVFVHGVLVGGLADVKRLDEQGEWAKLLAAGRPVTGARSS